MNKVVGKLRKIRFISAVLVPALLVLCSVFTALAGVYYSAQVSVNNAGSPIVSFPFLFNLDTEGLIAGDFITESGLDTRVTYGGSNVPHMLADDKLLFASDIPSGTASYQFTTGNTALDNFSIVTGYGGYVTTESFDLGTDFALGLKGYLGDVETYPVFVDNTGIYYSDETTVLGVMGSDYVTASGISKTDKIELAVSSGGGGGGGEAPINWLEEYAELTSWNTMGQGTWKGLGEHFDYTPALDIRSVGFMLGRTAGTCTGELTAYVMSGSTVLGTMGTMAAMDLNLVEPPSPDGMEWVYFSEPIDNDGNHFIHTSEGELDIIIGYQGTNTYESAYVLLGDDGTTAGYGDEEATWVQYNPSHNPLGNRDACFYCQAYTLVSGTYVTNYGDDMLVEQICSDGEYYYALVTYYATGSIPDYIVKLDSELTEIDRYTYDVEYSRITGLTYNSYYDKLYTMTISPNGVITVDPDTMSLVDQEFDVAEATFKVMCSESSDVFAITNTRTYKFNGADTSDFDSWVTYDSGYIQLGVKAHGNYVYMYEGQTLGGIAKIKKYLIADMSLLDTYTSGAGEAINSPDAFDLDDSGSYIYTVTSDGYIRKIGTASMSAVLNSDSLEVAFKCISINGTDIWTADEYVYSTARHYSTSFEFIEEIAFVSFPYSTSWCIYENEVLGFSNGLSDEIPTYISLLTGGGGGGNTLSIYVNDVLADSISTSETLPTTDNITWMSGNSMTYADYLYIEQGGVEVVRYQPEWYIEDTVMPDIDSTQDGVITWGENIGDITGTIGPFIPITSIVNEAPPTDLLPPTGPKTTEASPLTSSPIYPFVSAISTVSNFTDAQVWLAFGDLLVLIAVAGCLVLFQSHALIAGIAGVAATGFLVNQNIYPWFALIFAALFLIATVVWERVPSV